MGPQGVFLVLAHLSEYCSHLLEHWHYDDESRGTEGPELTHSGPCIELGEVEDVSTKHRSGPNANEEQCEGDGGNVGSDLGGSELADDDL